jgi:hypothetical protein
MKPLYDELSLPISITIPDRERIFRVQRAIPILSGAYLVANETEKWDSS